MPRAIVGAVALAGVAAAVVAVTRIAVAHPAAAADRNHVFSVLLALALAGYLAFALTPYRPGNHASTVLWWALAAALASGAVWTVIALAAPVQPDGITGYPWLVGAAVALAASTGAAAATGSSPAGARAGLLAVILTGPMHFTADLTAILQAGHYTLTNSYDIAAYPHSGYPDVASYLLSDAIAGDILAGLGSTPSSCSPSRLSAPRRPRASSRRPPACAEARSADTVNVRVTTPGGTSMVFAGDRFTHARAPAVTALAPASGPARGGAVVTVGGTHLTGATRVRSGTRPGTHLKVLNAPELKVTARRFTHEGVIGSRAGRGPVHRQRLLPCYRNQQITVTPELVLLEVMRTAPAPRHSSVPLPI